MRLLIVEDDQDGREMLAELFRMHAWEVCAVPRVDAAMVELRAGGFDVVISDEDLEGSSGSAMLREASEEGLLKNVGALMYTAQPSELELPRGVRVLQKPMGIASLVEAVAAAAADPPSSGERLRTTGEPVELVLYVTDSVQSRRALDTMESVLDEVGGTRVRVVIRNLDHEPLQSAEGPILVTPLLVKNSPGIQERFVGNLDSVPSLTALIHELAPPSSRAR
jgi:DNA-binding NtrC family response regulator